MAYINKTSSGLLNTKLTDVGRRKLASGRFNIQYFQIGDSEVSYSAITNWDSTNNYVLEPSFNAQNDTGAPQSNRQNIKYPFYVLGNKGNTFGLPILEPAIYPVYNPTDARGFFNGSAGYWYAKTDSPCDYTPPAPPKCPDFYVKTSDYVVDTCLLCGNNYIDLIYSPCNPVTTTTTTPIITTTTTTNIGCTTLCQNSGLTCDIQVGDILMIYFDQQDTCGVISRPFPILTYKVQGIDGLKIQLDRPTPYYAGSSCGPVTTTTTMLMGGPITTTTTTQYGDCCTQARVLIYPSGMTPYYDSITPLQYLTPQNVGFGNYSVPGVITPPIWNMNIPWSENPAGLIDVISESFEYFGSQTYIGSKEYFGYQTNTGQTFNVDSEHMNEITDTYFYNSFGEKVYVEPRYQKCISIVHYSNNALDNIYGEKFAMEPYNVNYLDNTGAARNFKVTIPWLMWHKNPNGEMGETFYVDPEGYELLSVKYMQSSVSSEMNNPGLRYFHLYDTHPSTNGIPNRVGKVFPDLKQIVFDDEEIVAAMSYKSNRNWTLPAPRLNLMTPNSCTNDGSTQGILSASTEYLYITYRFDNTTMTNALHCNYYTKIQGPTICTPSSSQNVIVQFGNEFSFLKSCCLQGVQLKEFKILAQKVTGTTSPDPTKWKVINYTDQLIPSMDFNGNITAIGMTGQTFVVTYDLYNNAPYYNLADYIDLPAITEPDELNFGDEFFFYGNVETDIMATIYELKAICNLPANSFTNTKNPTWNNTYTPYISEIGIYDEDKDLIIISKLQSPQVRQGTQQFVVQLDF
jgi:hypothetical protein